MAYIGSKPADKVLTASDIPDGIVSNAKLGSDIISGDTDIGANIVDADLFLVDDGAGGTLRKTAASRIKTYIGGGVNTPHFDVYLNTVQTISSGSQTKVTLNAAGIDPSSGLDTTNNRWTVPSGQDGTYFIAGSVFCGTSGGSRHQLADCSIRLNGSQLGGIVHDDRSVNGRKSTCNASNVIALEAGDYLELYGAIYDSTASPYFQGGTGNWDKYATHLCGFKLI